MLTGFDLTDGFRLKQSASEFVREPPEERINVRIACLEPKDVRGVIIAVCLVGSWLFAILRESEDVILIPHLLTHQSANVTHPTPDLA
jgi:hypothetical protein